MKVFGVLLIFVLQQYASAYSSLNALNPLLLDAGLACITFPQLSRATAIACSQRNNTVLWKNIIDCHRPMTDKFMRSSVEARCPNPKHVENPMDEANSIESVFFNVCGLVDGSPVQRLEGKSCMFYGNKDRKIMSHPEEVRKIKQDFGDEFPCKIGECIKTLFLNLGT